MILKPIIIWALFLVLNVLDGYTTYLGHKVGAKEKNPIFNMIGIGKNFKSAMYFKALIVFGGLWVLLRLYTSNPGKATFIFEVIDLVFIFVVVNNLYVYLQKKKGKVKVWSPISSISWVIQKCKIPKKASDILAFYVTIFALTYISMGIIKVLYFLPAIRNILG